MTTSPEHEGYKSLLSRLIDVLSEELNLEIRGFGSTTYQRQDLDRGLEPDECFYIANQARMRGVRRRDLTRDPPPDLVLEIEVSRSAVNRMALYASLGVPEVWRFDGETLAAYLLDASGQYAPSERSPTFPSVALEDFVRFARLGDDQGETTMARAFRAWLREQQPGAAQP
jgi:Uma2 family endonuclease